MSRALLLQAGLRTLVWAGIASLVCAQAAAPPLEAAPAIATPTVPGQAAGETAVPDAARRGGWIQAQAGGAWGAHVRGDPTPYASATSGVLRVGRDLPQDHAEGGRNGWEPARGWYGVEVASLSTHTRQVDPETLYTVTALSLLVGQTFSFSAPWRLGAWLGGGYGIYRFLQERELIGNDKIDIENRFELPCLSAGFSAEYVWRGHYGLSLNGSFAQPLPRAEQPRISGYTALTVGLRYLFG